MTTSTNSSKKILLEAVLCLNYGWKQHPHYGKEGQCDICFDDSMIGSYVLELPCGHVYHYGCILIPLADYKRMSCPTCGKVYTSI